MSRAPELVLASASPRRADLLSNLGVACRVEVANIDERLRPEEAPAQYVGRLAREKAEAVMARLADRASIPVLAADTTVVIDSDMLGKPEDRIDALAMLARLSGRRHSVFTGVCLLVPGEDAAIEVVETEVQFVNLTRADCEAYIASGEPFDKAGGYGIQGLGGALVKAIHGSYSNVVGLPLAETRLLLRRAGVMTALEVADE